eukprot:355477-Chlamydomonas_euryale.AAC.3
MARRERPGYVARVSASTTPLAAAAPLAEASALAPDSAAAPPASLPTPSRSKVGVAVGFVGVVARAYWCSVMTRVRGPVFNSAWAS